MPSHPILPRLNFPPPFLALQLSLCSKWDSGIRSGSCGQSIVTFHLCFSFLLLLISSCNMGSFPQDTALPKLLQCGFFLWTEAVHKVLQHGFFAQSTGLKNRLLQCGFSTGHSSCQQTGFSVGSTWTATSFMTQPLPSTWDLPWAAVCSISAPLCSMGCNQPALPCSAPWDAGESLLWQLSTPTPVPTLTLVSAGLFQPFFLMSESFSSQLLCSVFTLSKVHLYRDTMSVTALISFDEWWVHLRAS